LNKCKQMSSTTFGGQEHYFLLKILSQIHSPINYV
jgi:hypothetical protein